MSKPIFKLSSEQLTLLTAFEETKGLAKLAESLMRDPSVISRALQRIAEDFPVLVKVGLNVDPVPVNGDTKALGGKTVQLNVPATGNTKRLAPGGPVQTV